MLSMLHGPGQLGTASQHETHQRLVQEYRAHLEATLRWLWAQIVNGQQSRVQQGMDVNGGTRNAYRLWV